jgi:xanthine phosphoribosyltransferase
MAYEEELMVSWGELHRDARELARRLHQRGEWKGVIAVTRGGMVPAALVARELDLRWVDTVCVASYQSGEPGAAATNQGELRILKRSGAGDGTGWLLIDDLADTGRTARLLRTLLPKAFFATLYVKPAGREHVDLSIREVQQRVWIHFPWDLTYRFAKPIKEDVWGGSLAPDV